ncbi:TPA: phosphoribosylamine--glycine ligase [Candidatus Poribacteria bacterium]|nr:phosphoribosylamine--glycine ligase [Candidatus Poribacteria bacterium]
MRVLVIGSGGREHTYLWKIVQSPMVDKVYCVPGNAGIAQIAECRDIALSADFSDLADFVQAEDIDLTVVGPEAPLAAGLVDQFASRGLRAFGPSLSAAELESSKSFAKNLMNKYNIPTAEYRIFHHPAEATAYVKKIGAPIVVKASGLAAGKGVLLCQTENEARQAIQDIMVERVFGAAGDTVVIEEFLEGEEATFTALTDGETILPMVTSQDHKPVFDGDRGLNTGGMGAYSPAPVVTEEMHHKIMTEIIEPTIRGMANEGRMFVGILYAGLMIDAEGPKVLEFNCRLGDPEAQVILPRLGSDLIPALEACVNGTLNQVQLEWKPEPAVCVVMASGGYPQRYETGKIITGLMEAEAMDDVIVFHAGTATDKDGDFITNGGRVLGVTALGRDIKTAIDRAYEAVGKIHFDKVHYRRDIGYRVMNR